MRVRALLPGLFRAGALGVWVLAAISAGGSAEDPFLALGVDRPKEVRPAPALTLPGLDGREVSVTSDLRGKPVLLSFFTTT